jgi:hypothetical protein
MPSDKPDICLGANPVNGKLRYRLDGQCYDGHEAWIYLRSIGLSDQYLDALYAEFKDRIKGKCS